MDSTKKLDRLVTETEALLDEISDEDGPEIDEIRGRLTQSLKRTKKLLGSQQNGSHVKARDVAASVNHYVKHYPWLALATGVLLASSIGILATGATKRSSYRQGQAV
jgi:ElaB/YqjD/DUF883 family membrane-anchored ribosome-binding protein